MKGDVNLLRGINNQLKSGANSLFSFQRLTLLDLALFTGKVQ
jgi:hypothetical protein